MVRILAGRRVLAGVACALSLGFECPVGPQFDRALAQRLMDKELSQVTSHTDEATRTQAAAKWHATSELGAFDPGEVVRPPLVVTGVANGPGVGLGALLAAGAEKLATFTVSTIVLPDDKRRHQIGGVAYFKKYDDGWRIEAILANSFR